MFKPKWKKEARLLNKAAKKFLNYKRDLLKEDQIKEIESRREDLTLSIKSGKKEQCAEASKQLQSTCDNSLSHYKPQGAVEENIEVIFVAIVVALGLRAYVVQPFRIPTGSMQPTLNGIIATPVKSTDEFPSLAVRTAQRITHGRSYVDLKLKEDKELRAKNPVVEMHSIHVPVLNINIPSFNFVTNTHIYFKDGSEFIFPGPKTALMSPDGMNFAQKCGYPLRDNEVLFYEQKAQEEGQPTVAYDIANKHSRPYFLPKLKAGTVIARGYVDSGDLILVNKMAYHFRSPKRGEVFVFDTRKIKRIHAEARERGTAAGSHYIKRLAATPGDELEVKGNDLYINGERAQEPGFQKVMSHRDGYRYGYGQSERLEHGHTFKAHKSKKPGKNEYIALGDNSFNSSDSRHWGTVKEFNVIGPASISLWPFGSGHWGFIK